VLPEHVAQIGYEKRFFSIRLASRGELTGVLDSIVHMQDGLAGVKRG